MSDAIKDLTNRKADADRVKKAKKLIKSLGDKHVIGSKFEYHPAQSKVLNDFKLRREAERAGLVEPEPEILPESQVLPLRKRQS